MNNIINEMFIRAIGNNTIRGYKAYYKIKDAIVVTPEFSLEVLREYMQEYETQYPESELIGIENQETGEVIEK